MEQRWLWTGTGGSGPELLSQLLERWFALAPQWRTPDGNGRGCLYLDEIQLIPGWEGFVRRVIDSEPIDVVITGSSAQMLSSEIATAMRGREHDSRPGVHPAGGEHADGGLDLLGSLPEPVLVNYTTLGGIIHGVGSGQPG